MRKLVAVGVLLSLAFAACGEVPKKAPPKPMTPEEIAAKEEAARLKSGNEMVNATRATIKNVAQGVELFQYDFNRFPASLADLMTRPGDIDHRVWRGPYYVGDTKDGWGTELAYRSPGRGEHPYEVISWGEDAKEGGADFGVDLTNHD